jgi:hypothetical protein
MASYMSATAADDKVSQFITEGGYNAAATPVSEPANNNKKRKVEQDPEVSILQPTLALLY